MKSIIVKREDSTAMYTSGWKYGYNEDGTTYEIEESEDEQMQECYRGLIRQIKREEFEKTLVAVVLGYLEWDKKDCENIKIVVDGKGHCEMNMTVTFDWSKATPIQLPSIDIKE